MMKKIETTTPLRNLDKSMRYTLYMDGKIIASHDDIGVLVDMYADLENDCKEDMLIMDNLTDLVAYG